MRENIILVDDHAMILEGLSSFLSKTSEFNVIAKLSTKTQIECFINQYKNQNENTVALVDLSFSDNAIHSNGGGITKMRVLALV